MHTGRVSTSSHRGHVTFPGPQARTGRTGARRTLAAPPATDVDADDSRPRSSDVVRRSRRSPTSSSAAPSAWDDLGPGDPAPGRRLRPARPQRPRPRRVVVAAQRARRRLRPRRPRADVGRCQRAPRARRRCSAPTRSGRSSSACSSSSRRSRRPSSASGATSSRPLSKASLVLLAVWALTSYGGRAAARLGGPAHVVTAPGVPQPDRPGPAPVAAVHDVPVRQRRGVGGRRHAHRPDLRGRPRRCSSSSATCSCCRGCRR